jgi:hypothetical protein
MVEDVATDESTPDEQDAVEAVPVAPAEAPAGE